MIEDCHVSEQESGHNVFFFVCVCFFLCIPVFSGEGEGEALYQAYYYQIGVYYIFFAVKPMFSYVFAWKFLFL